MTHHAAGLRDRLTTAGDRKVFDDLVAARPTVWAPDHTDHTAHGATSDILDPSPIDAAEARFRWFAPLFEQLFPDTRDLGGIAESLDQTG